jgi:spore coat polysaccharide biosynthesis protein SpsF (cytidylyltransferase family)
VAWPERYPDLDENDVRERFRRISKEFPSKNIIRLTSDCPLLTAEIINEAIQIFEVEDLTYYCNRDTRPRRF